MTEGNPRGTERIVALVGRLRGKSRRGEPENKRFVVPARRAGFSLRPDINGRQVIVTSTPLPAADLPARPGQEVAGSAKDSALSGAAAAPDVSFRVIDDDEKGADSPERPLTGAELFAAVRLRIAEKSLSEDLTEEEARFAQDEAHQQTLLAGVTLAEEALARVAAGLGRPTDMTSIIAGGRIKQVLEELLHGERADEPEAETGDVVRETAVDSEVTEESD